MNKFEFLKLCGSQINSTYSGDPLTLKSFIASIDLLKDVGANQLDTLKLFVLARLSGKAQDCVRKDPKSVDEIIIDLNTFIKPDDSKIIESRIQALRFNTSKPQEFTKQAEELADALQRTLILEGVGQEKARKLTVERTIDLCRQSARTDFVRGIIASTPFETPKDVLAKFIVENCKEKVEKQIFSMRYHNDRSNDYQNQYSNDNNNENFDQNHQRSNRHNNYNRRYQNRQNDNNNFSFRYRENNDMYNDTDDMRDDSNQYNINVMREEENVFENEYQNEYENEYENDQYYNNYDNRNENDEYNNNSSCNGNEFENVEYNHINNYNENEYVELSNNEQEQDEHQIFTIKMKKKHYKNDYVTLHTSISRDERKFLLDSEGDGCFIKYNALMGNVKINRRNKTCITGITPDRIYTYGTVWARINFGKFFVNQIFHVIPSICRIPYDGLIGNDFMRRHRCILNYGNSSFVIRSRYGSAKLKITNTKQNHKKYANPNKFINKNKSKGSFKTNEIQKTANVRRNYANYDNDKYSIKCLNKNSNEISNSNEHTCSKHDQTVTIKTEVVRGLNENKKKRESIEIPNQTYIYKCEGNAYNPWHKNKNKMTTNSCKNQEINNKNENCKITIENWRYKSNEELCNGNEMNNGFCSIRRLST